MKRLQGYRRLNVALPFAVIVIAHALPALAMDDETAAPLTDADDSHEVKPDTLDDACKRPDIQFTLRPTAWLARTDASTRFGRTGATWIDLASDLRLGSMEPTFAADFAVRFLDRWEVAFEGYEFSASSSGTLNRDVRFGSLNLQSGDTFDASLDVLSVAGTVRYAFHRGFDGPEESYRTGDGLRRVDARLGPQLTLRFIDIENSIRSSGRGEETADGRWLALIPGGHVELTFRPDLPRPGLNRIVADLEAGYGVTYHRDRRRSRRSSIAQIRAGITWYLSENFAVTVGYRLLHTDLRRRSFRFDGGVKGLYVGGAFTF
jgi:hypothetical protein